ncbi:MAG: hypothetical protein H6679_01185 [Epsilonproteobacteria bacterium]|nr:hypothetical protein [Campylobacterota bacterium]
MQGIARAVFLALFSISGFFGLCEGELSERYMNLGQIKRLIDEDRNDLTGSIRNPVQKMMLLAQLLWQNPTQSERIRNCAEDLIDFGYERPVLVWLCVYAYQNGLIDHSFVQRDNNEQALRSLLEDRSIDSVSRVCLEALIDSTD